MLARHDASGSIRPSARRRAYAVEALLDARRCGTSRAEPGWAPEAAATPHGATPRGSDVCPAPPLHACKTRLGSARFRPSSGVAVRERVLYLSLPGARGVAWEMRQPFD